MHTHGFTEEEMLQQKAVIYNNTVQAMASLLRGMKTLNIPLENPQREVSIFPHLFF